MMKSVLEEFARGNISPYEIYFKRDSESGEASQRAAAAEKQLFDRLAADDKALFAEYQDAAEDLSYLAAISHFTAGFKLGLTMTAEAFTGIGDLYIGKED